MDRVDPPNPVLLKEQRGVFEDQEQQSATISSDHHRHARSQTWWQHPFTRLRRQGSWRPKDLPPLPVTMQTGTSSSRAFPSEEGVPLGTLDPNLQDLHTRRIRDPEHQSTKTKTVRNRVIKVVDTILARHNTRKMDILEALAPLINSDQADHSFVLLCWGKPNHCHIIPVKVSNSLDNMTIWQEIRRGWYASQGSWRKYMPLLDVSQVHIVNILIAGRELRSNRRSKPKHGFVGTYTAEKVDAEEELEQIIASYDPKEFPCTYDPSTGRTHCFDDCISNALPDSESCPERTLREAERKLLRSKMRPFLTLAFSDPSIGMVNDLLDGEDVIISQLNLLSKLNAWHQPSLGELHFRGLMIREDWRSNSSQLLLLLIVTAFTLMVLGVKLVYGDWGIAWTVGCYLVALASLLIDITVITCCQTEV